jgi:hypothetical protein
LPLSFSMSFALPTLGTTRIAYQAIAVHHHRQIAQAD